MEKTYPVEISGFRKPLGILGPESFSSGFMLGRIEKVIGPGRFIVVLDNGVRVTAMGSKALKVNTRVRVFPPEGIAENKGSEREVPPLAQDNGIQWTAIFPLGFGGSQAQARLQVFVERKKEGSWAKRTTAAYFVFWVNTEKQGLLQWSVHLKGRQVALQVYSDGKGPEKNSLRALSATIEKNLQSRGFSLMASTVFLAHAFRVPEGFHLGLRG